MSKYCYGRWRRCGGQMTSGWDCGLTNHTWTWIPGHREMTGIRRERANRGLANEDRKYRKAKAFTAGRPRQPPI
ncbi:unnamed protein product, partial [Nesidiocoris tenuis]